MVVSTEAKWSVYIASRSVHTKEDLILQYAPLVKYVVGRLAIGLPSIMDYEDVLSHGTLGLIEAVERFDPSKGVKFETYAIARIRGAIIDSLRALDRLPRSVRQKAREVDKAVAALEASLGRAPSDVEIAGHLGVTTSRYHEMIVDASWSTVSLEGMLDIQDYGESAAPMEIADENAHDEVVGGVERTEVSRVLAESVRGLPEREQLIVSLYYQDELTMREISRVLNISESRVCQLHAKAVSRLRTAMRKALE